MSGVGPTLPAFASKLDLSPFPLKRLQLLRSGRATRYVKNRRIVAMTPMVAAVGRHSRMS
jgi:hypothetical protein